MRVRQLVVKSLTFPFLLLCLNQFKDSYPYLAAIELLGNSSSIAYQLKVEFSGRLT